jgi:hypothetical protein
LIFLKNVSVVSAEAKRKPPILQDFVALKTKSEGVAKTVHKKNPASGKCGTG